MNDETQTYSRLGEFEERAASLYKNFARRFVDNRELSWFWLEMSMEEKQHALFLEFCGWERVAIGTLPDKDTIQRLSDLFRDLENRAAQKDLSMDDAFLIAAELESSEVNDIYARVIGPIKGTGYVLQKKIQTLIPNHMQTLIRGAREFGVSPSTMTKLLRFSAGKLRGELIYPARSCR
jgi:hypothetical protein